MSLTQVLSLRCETTDINERKPALGGKALNRGFDLADLVSEPGDSRLQRLAHHRAVAYFHLQGHAWQPKHRLWQSRPSAILAWRQIRLFCPDVLRVEGGLHGAFFSFRIHHACPPEADFRSTIDLCAYEAPKNLCAL